MCYRIAQHLAAYMTCYVIIIIYIIVLYYCCVLTACVEHASCVTHAVYRLVVRIIDAPEIVSCNKNATKPHGFCNCKTIKQWDGRDYRIERVFVAHKHNNI